MISFFLFFITSLQVGFSWFLHKQSCPDSSLGHSLFSYPHPGWFRRPVSLPGELSVLFS